MTVTPQDISALILRLRARAESALSNLGPETKKDLILASRLLRELENKPIQIANLR